LVVDDHFTTHANVLRLLAHEPDMIVVSHCTTFDESRNVLATKDVDVVLLGYVPGNDTHTALLRTSLQRGHTPRILLMTSGMEVAELHRALDAGVSGVVLQDSRSQQLVHAIRAVVEGNQWWDESALRGGITHIKRSIEISRPTITKRQIQILHDILDGLSNKEIGARLGVSESAVKASIQELFHKAGVRTRSQLVRTALEEHSEDWLRSQDSGQTAFAAQSAVTISHAIVRAVCCGIESQR
jgi:DNA-binding NarL/FixJ family response regulator